MSANLDAKKVIVEEIKEKIKSAKSLTFVDYRGLTAVEDTELRSAFRKAGAEYKVYKNRLLLLALEELGMTGYESILQGTTAVAFGTNDEVAAPKILVDTIKQTKKMQLKGGILNGNQIDVAMVGIKKTKVSLKCLLISRSPNFTLHKNFFKNSHIIIEPTSSVPLCMIKYLSRAFSPLTIVTTRTR